MRSEFVVDGLTRLVAPILSVTAEEVWERLSKPREASVHMAEFPTLTRDLTTWRDDLVNGPFGQRWTRVLELRDLVNEKIEGARQQKVVMLL